MIEGLNETPTFATYTSRKIMGAWSDMFDEPRNSLFVWSFDLDSCCHLLALGRTSRHKQETAKQQNATSLQPTNLCKTGDSGHKTCIPEQHNRETEQQPEEYDESSSGAQQTDNTNKCLHFTFLTFNSLRGPTGNLKVRNHADIRNARKTSQPHPDSAP